MPFKKRHRNSQYDRKTRPISLIRGWSKAFQILSDFTEQTWPIILNTLSAEMIDLLIVHTLFNNQVVCFLFMKTKSKKKSSYLKQFQTKECICMYVCVRLCVCVTHAHIYYIHYIHNYSAYNRVQNCKLMQSTENIFS